MAAGYWPRSFFACLRTETKSSSIYELARKERGQYQAILTKQAWSIKDLLYGFRGNFSSRTLRIVPSGQDGSILLARVANHNAEFYSSCPLAELGRDIIKIFFSRMTCMNLLTILRFVVFQTEVICFSQVKNTVGHMYANEMAGDNQQNANF